MRSNDAWADYAEVGAWNDLEVDAKARAKWIGKATTLANNLPDFPFKDNEAAKWKAEKG